MVGRLLALALPAAGCLDRRLQLCIQIINADRDSGLPQPFEAVVGALLGQKDVDDEVDIVHQDPFALAAALDRVRKGREVALEADLDLVGDSDVLPVVGAVADEKVVGQAALSGVEGKNLDILRLLILAGRGSSEQQFVALDRRHRLLCTPYPS